MIHNSIFSASSEMLALGIPALRIISVSFAVASITMLTGYFASGLGDGMTNMIGAFLRQFFPLIPCAYLFSRIGEIGLVWYSIWLSELVAVIFAVLRLHLLINSKVSIMKP